MAYKCQICGKGVQYGHRVSHSKRRTKRIFKPNLHRVRVLGKGQRKILVCTKCLRRVKSQQPKPVPKKETPAEKSV